MPEFDWICPVCSYPNRGERVDCAACACPVIARPEEIESRRQARAQRKFDQLQHSAAIKLGRSVGWVLSRISGRRPGPSHAGPSVSPTHPDVSASASPAMGTEVHERSELDLGTGGPGGEQAATAEPSTSVPGLPVSLVALTAGGDDPVSGFIQRAWRGQLPFWQVFWLAGLPLVLLPVVLDPFLGEPKGLFSALSLLIGSAAMFGVFVAWSIMAWRCSRNVKAPIWTYVGRFFLIFIWLRMLADVFEH